MFFKKRDAILLGKVEKELELHKRFGILKWRWQRRFFKKMRIDLKTMINPHIMITGESGSGKSNVCKQILGQLAELGCDFLVLDPHSEYVEEAKDFGACVYDAVISGVNVFDLDGLSERERTAEITSMFRRIFRLGEVQAYTLYKCISYSYMVCMNKGRTPTLHDLIFTIKIFKRHAGKAEATVLETLEKRLLVISGESSGRGVSVSGLLNARSIFSLSSMHTSEAQTVFMESMLKKVYGLMLGRKKQGAGRFYVVIDEAEKLQNSPVVARLVAEGRKYGIGIISISQRAKALDKEIRSNAATFIAFAQREPEEQNYVANMLAGGNEYNRFAEVRKALRELGRGQAMVQEARSRNPKLVKCVRFEAKHRDPSYMIIKLAEKAASLQELTGRLSEEEFEVETVLESISALEKKGALKRHFVSDGEYRGTWYMTFPRNSAEHDIMVNLISRHLSGLGIRNVVYNKAYGPDVIAFIDGKRVAVEYETGKKDPESTARMLEERRSKYSQVIVVERDRVNCESIPIRASPSVPRQPPESCRA
jgi:hypothetical protein